MTDFISNEPFVFFAFNLCNIRLYSPKLKCPDLNKIPKMKIMKTFLLSCLLLFTSLNALENSQIILNKASIEDTYEIQDQQIYFYSKELCDAGLFEDLRVAIEAAKIESLGRYN